MSFPESAAEILAAPSPRVSLLTPGDLKAACRAHLSEAAKRRTSRVNRDFYWQLLAWAARARREAMRRSPPRQADLFGVAR